MAKKLACPRCGKPSSFDPANPWRPFCSERCKMVDLGKWGSEQYRVEGAEQIPGEKPQSQDDG